MKTKQVIDIPEYYLHAENKVIMIRKLSEIQMMEKEKGTHSYNKKYDEAIGALLDSIIKETKELDNLTFSSNERGDN